jgi:carbon monoxide dehydrogenase subunit G
MKIENSFDVPTSPEAAWELLMDVPRIIPCMPGAKLDEVVADDAWKATMQVKLGPIGLTFATDVKREEVDEAERRVKLAADAREVRNRGNARATIESSLTGNGGGTQVSLVTELALTGTVAQYGRGMIEDISSQLVSSFAECIKSRLADEPDEAEQAVATHQQPVSGLTLFFGASRRALRRHARSAALAALALGAVALSRARRMRRARVR